MLEDIGLENVSVQFHSERRCFELREIKFGEGFKLHR